MQLLAVHGDVRHGIGRTGEVHTVDAVGVLTALLDIKDACLHAAVVELVDDLADLREEVTPTLGREGIDIALLVLLCDNEVC